VRWVLTFGKEISVAHQRAVESCSGNGLVKKGVLKNIWRKLGSRGNSRFFRSEVEERGGKAEKVKRDTNHRETESSPEAAQNARRGGADKGDRASRDRTEGKT